MSHPPNIAHPLTVRLAGWRKGGLAGELAGGLADGLVGWPAGGLAGGRAGGDRVGLWTGMWEDGNVGERTSKLINIQSTSNYSGGKLRPERKLLPQLTLQFRRVALTQTFPKDTEWLTLR